MDVAIIGLISLCVTSLTALGLAWIAYRTAKLSKAVEEVRHNTNSLTEALVAKTATVSRAEGKLEGQHEAAAAGAVPPVIKPP